MPSISQSEASLHPLANREQTGRSELKWRRGQAHRRSWAALGLAILVSMPWLLAWSPSRGDEPAALPASAQTLFDDRLAKLRVASVSWMNRQGPQRKVIDQVCLVPDLPSFLEALACWDDRYYFPILLDDPETNLRFLRAFRPARVVRLPEPAQAIPVEELWTRALEAVGRSWVSGDQDPMPADRVPKKLGPTPPGLVISNSGSPSLAGALALAAGRFQALLHWMPPKSGDEVLELEEAVGWMADLERRVAAVVPDYGILGDDCDFLTLAGDWPDRYQIAEGPKKGQAALDDLFGRRSGDAHRWAFVGRLSGDPIESVYQAMCSLFLQPESALLLNGYDEKGKPWSEYQMRDAETRLAEQRPTFQRVGPDQANLAGWHQAFDPINRHGLVLINSSGNPSNFNLPGGGGKTSDIPMSVPVAVLMIHSFSAARPNDIGTIAGRWRANGAFLYFGSLNEPYLPAFRTPTLVANLLADGLPVSASVRKLVAEDQFGTPWRLVYLGDPLYRLDPNMAKALRIKPIGPSKEWPPYRETAPAPEASPSGRLRWALEAAIIQAARLEGGAARQKWQEEFLKLDRRALADSDRLTYDALLADLITFARPGVAWPARVAAIPEDQRSEELRRSLEARQALGVESAEVLSSRRP